MGQTLTVKVEEPLACVCLLGKGNVDFGEVVLLTQAERTRGYSHHYRPATAEEVAGAVTCSDCGRIFLTAEMLTRHVAARHTPPPPETAEETAKREREAYAARRKLRIEHARRAGEAEALGLEIEELTERLEGKERECDAAKVNDSDRTARTAWYRQEIAAKSAALRSHLKRLDYLRRALGLEAN